LQYYGFFVIFINIKHSSSKMKIQNSPQQVNFTPKIELDRCYKWLIKNVYSVISQKKLGFTSKREALAEIRVLAEREDEILIQSPQGFLLIFRDRTPDDLARQLRYFDLDEWREPSDMALFFPIELEGLVESKRLRDASDLFALCSSETLALLNQDILNFSASNVEFYNYIHSTDPFRVKARIQALTVLPMLKWEFFSFNKVSDRVRRRIDAGESVWDAYLEFHPGKASILRRLSTTQASPAPWRGNLEGLLAALDPVAPEKVPCNDEEWNAFDSICLGMKMNGMENGYTYRRPLHQTVKRRWVAESSRMGWINAYQKFAAIDGGVDAIGDAFDFLDAIANAGNYMAQQSGVKFFCNEEYQKKSSERWLKATQTFGMFRIVEWSARWHRMLLDDTVHSDQNDEQLQSWPCLLPERVQLDSSVSAVSLGNSQALALEGKIMQHCVGGYSSYCFFGRTHIISLRDSNDRSLSTLEITTDEYNERCFQIVQHKGYRNCSPDRSLISLETNLLSAILRNADFKALAESRKKASKIYADMKDKKNQTSVEHVAAVMGQDRLMRLFQSDAPH
jgi:hypothetical protein